MKYAEGMALQKNDAHFLEMSGALSIIDFVDNINNFDNSVKEFGIAKEESSLTFDSLGQETKRILNLPLSKLSLLEKFIDNSINILKGKAGPFSNESITKDFYNTEFYKTNLVPFLKYFKEWLNEMESNDVAFAPYHNNQKHDNLMDFIKGYEPKKKMFTKKENGDIIIKALNKSAKQGDFKSENKPSLFIKSFDKVLNTQVNELLK